jgi:hypothetical protein
MTRDETIALFLECEAKRAEARKAALDQGKSENEAKEIAHEAAKAHWNAWAQEMLDEKKALESANLFLMSSETQEDLFEYGGNKETEYWLSRSAARFSRYNFKNDKSDNDNSIFENYLRFSGYIFPGYTDFSNCKFNDYTIFSGSIFCNNVSFGWAVFYKGVRFSKCIFNGVTVFEICEFKNAARFEETNFKDVVSFSLAEFEQFATFKNAHFFSDSHFYSSNFKAAFNLEYAIFDIVPDFIQTHFEEAPRLDNLIVGNVSAREQEQLSQSRYRHHPNFNIPPRWQALKRLAIQAHDTDRELEFNAQEIRAERAASRWPVPNRVSGWKIWLRSFLGWLYGFFSDYGRSLVRPFVAWAIASLAFTAFYLSQTEVMQRDLSLEDAWWGSAAAQAGHYAVANKVPCYAREAIKDTTSVGGLTKEVRDQTNARAEALHLAFRNAFVVLDGGSDATHRMYGCLYGLELYAGQNPVPIVPSAVSTASAIQKLISGVLIFLFGLALRNMLKVK